MSIMRMEESLPKKNDPTTKEDASRLISPFNGMFLDDPVEHVVHDFVHGAEDIKRQVIRTIGSADERFL